MRTDENYCQINDQNHQIMHITCFLGRKLKIFLVPPKLHKCHFLLSFEIGIKQHNITI